MILIDGYGSKIDQRLYFYLNVETWVAVGWLSVDCQRLHRPDLSRLAHPRPPTNLPFSRPRRRNVLPSLLPPGDSSRWAVTGRHSRSWRCSAAARRTRWWLKESTLRSGRIDDHQENLGGQDDGNQNSVGRFLQLTLELVSLRSNLHLLRIEGFVIFFQ